MTDESTREWLGFTARLLTLAAVTIAVVGACDRPYGEHLPEDDETTTDVEEIEDETESFVGKTVSVVGEVDTTYTDRAFELEGLDWIFEDDVLVVGKNPIKIGERAMDTDDLVRIEGKVWKFSQGRLETELGWKFDPAFEAEWSDRPVIVASKIEVVRRQAAWHDNDEESGILTSPWPHDWSSASLDKAGVDFKNVRVNQVGKEGLWMGPDQPGVFVMPENPEVLIALEEGDYIKLEGNVRKLDSAGELPRSAKLSSSEKKELEQKGAYIVATALTKTEPPEGDQG